MSTFILAFVLLMLVVVGMSLGVMLMGTKDIDPDSPLRDKLMCKRKREMLERLEAETDAADAG
ncbi:MAG: hypothetical protein CSA73_00505 [Rhodobacterales bacterium]|nr:MAG: hypothetical protein CSA73_00505 [Rhodobacterales bacterium]